MSGHPLRSGHGNRRLHGDAAGHGQRCKHSDVPAAWHWKMGNRCPDTLHTEPRHLKIGENCRFYADFGYSTNIPFLHIPWGGHYLFLAKPLSSRRFTDSMVTGMILGTVCPGRVSLGRKYCLKGNVTKVEEAGLHAYEPMLGGSFTCILTQQLGLEARACLRKHRGPSGPTTNIAHHCHYPSIGLFGLSSSDKSMVSDPDLPDKI